MLFKLFKKKLCGFFVHKWRSTIFPVCGFFVRNSQIGVKMVLAVLVINIRFNWILASSTNILKMSPRSKICHQHFKIVTNCESVSSLWPAKAACSFKRPTLNIWNILNWVLYNKILYSSKMNFLHVLLDFDKMKFY